MISSVSFSVRSSCKDKFISTMKSKTTLHEK
jgi:hypothetical protein